LVIVLFITSRAIQTLPKRIWDGIQDRIDPTIASVAVILILITFVLLLIDVFWRQRRARQRQDAAAAQRVAGLSAATG
jgi:putative spermidine/putrescine transport system permease protein